MRKLLQNRAVFVSIHSSGLRGFTGYEELTTCREDTESNSDEPLGPKTKKRPDGRSSEIPYFYLRPRIAHITKMSSKNRHSSEHLGWNRSCSGLETRMRQTGARDARMRRVARRLKEGPPSEEGGYRGWRLEIKYLLAAVFGSRGFQVTWRTSLLSV
jgi:hypothetical protein